MVAATAGGSSGPPPLPALRVNVATLRRRDVDRSVAAGCLPVEWLCAVLGDTDAQVEKAGHVGFDIMLPRGGPVFVDGRLSLSFIVPCGRCLEAAPVDGAGRMQATYAVGQSPRPVADDEDDDGLADDDLDTWTYDGTTLDLGALVAEHVKIAYPMRALCSRAEACQGLCSGCGINMNERPARNGACAGCGQAFEGPVGEPGSPTDKDSESPDSDADGPLATALRKLRLPD